MRSAADAWESVFQREGHVFPEPFLRFPELLEAFHRHECHSLLDLGCGSGRHVVGLARRGYRVCGLDLSPTGLRLAGEWLRKETLRASLVLADSRLHLPFQAGAFDGLLSTQVIHHATLETVRFTIRELRRVLRTEGLIFITVPARLEDDLHYEEIEPATFIPTSGSEAGVPHHIFSRDQLEFELAGFRTLELSLRGSDVLAFLGVKEAERPA